MSDYNPTDLDGQRRAQEDADRTVAALRVRAEADFRWLMSGPKGRRFVWYLLSLTRALNSSFSTNAMQMSHSEGRKEIGYALMGMVESLGIEDDYRTMMMEARGDFGGTDTGTD